MKKQLVADLIDIFDEEYEERRLITPRNTAEKLTGKGYCKASDVAEEIFTNIERMCIDTFGYFNPVAFLELKKKYTEKGESNDAHARDER